MKITRTRALKLSALGALTLSVSALIACGGFDNPTTSTPHVGSGGSSGTSSMPAAGTSSVAGTFSSAGTVATGGGGATGTAGDSSVAGTFSAGGTTPVTAPFCSATASPVQPRVPLPFAVTTAFTPSGYEGGDPGQNGGGQIAAGACVDRAPGAIGSCAKYTYTPATPATWAGVAYIRGYQGFGSAGHAPLCLADGATAVTFYAKGAAGGEVVGFSAGTAMAATFTLTNQWALYTIPVSGLQYNTDASGLEDGFFWKVAPTAGAAVLTAFYVDDIQYVGATGAGGAGGAGGTSAGGSGGTGGGAGGAGGTGGSAGTGGASGGGGVGGH